MKLFFGFILLAVTVNLINGQTTDCTSFIDFGALLKSKIIAFQKQLIEKYTKTIQLTDTKIQLDNEQLELKLDLVATGKIDGLLTFAIDDNKIHIYVKKAVNGTGGYNLKYRVDFNDGIDINIDSYDLQAKFGLTKLFGKGKLRLKIKKLSIENIECVPLLSESKDGKTLISLADFSINLIVDPTDFNFKITGWLNDEPRSEYLSTLITNLITAVFDPSNTEMAEKLNEMVGKLIFNMLKGKQFPLM